MARKWKGSKLKHSLIICSTLMIPKCGRFPDLHLSDNEGEQPRQGSDGCGEEERLVEFHGFHLRSHTDNTISRSPLLNSPLSSPLKINNAFSCKPTTPKGYLAMYVGEEKRRFLVKTHMVNHPLFSVLLEKAKEEFGFEQKGPLTIPCDIAFFEHILLKVESNDPCIEFDPCYSPSPNHVFR